MLLRGILNLGIVTCNNIVQAETHLRTAHALLDVLRPGDRLIGQTNKLLGSVIYARQGDAAEGIAYIERGVAA